MKGQVKGQTQSTRITTIVTTDNPELLIKEARDLAGGLRGDEATKTQVRRLFSTLQQIEMSWPREVKEDDPEAQKERNDAYRELLLFQPRLAYQARQHRSLKRLATALEEGIDAVSQDRDREKLQRLVQFFEATLAYYIAGK